MKHVFTSESVTEGHPDKVADQISDGVLDAVLRDDPYGRVACETLVNTGLVVVSGEISTSTYVDIQDVVRSTIRRIRGKFRSDSPPWNSTLIARDGLWNMNSIARSTRSSVR